MNRVVSVPFHRGVWYSGVTNGALHEAGGATSSCLSSARAWCANVRARAGLHQAQRTKQPQQRSTRMEVRSGRPLRLSRATLGGDSSCSAPDSSPLDMMAEISARNCVCHEESCRHVGGMGIRARELSRHLCSPKPCLISKALRLDTSVTVLLQYLGLYFGWTPTLPSFRSQPWLCGAHERPSDDDA